MKVLVTGSGGFIGQHLLREISREGHQVLGLDSRSTGPESASGSVRCDILDPGSLRTRFGEFQPEALIHLAARTDLEGRSLHDYAANIQGVTNLLAAVRETPSMRRAIFASTQLVCRVGYVPRHETDYCPSTLYGQSKVASERLVRESDGGGVVWCIVRPTTVWGPGMSEHYRRFFRLMARGWYVHVGRKPLLKSYGYVGNVVWQLQRMLAAPAEQIHRKTFYVADYAPISVRAWADAFQKELGAPPIKTCPEPVARVLGRLGDALNVLGLRGFPFNSFRLRNLLTEYQFDLSETERVCGPLPFSIDHGVAETAAWLKGLAT